MAEVRGREQRPPHPGAGLGQGGSRCGRRPSSCVTCVCTEGPEGPGMVRRWTARFEVGQCSGHRAGRQTESAVHWDAGTPKRQIWYALLRGAPVRYVGALLLAGYDRETGGLACTTWLCPQCREALTRVEC